ncbi:unnamed protein product, partial [Sphagnum jensenii]
RFHQICTLKKQIETLSHSNLSFYAYLYRSGSSTSVGTLSSEIEAFKGLLQVHAFHQGHDF